MSSGQFPIAVGSRPIVPSSPSVSSFSSRLSGRLLCRKLRGTRSKRGRKSQFISFQAGRAAGDRDSDFPPPRAPSHPFTEWTGLNDAWKSIASISRALSLVTQSRFANCEIFISPPGVFDSLYARGVCSTCYNRDLFRIEWLIMRRAYGNRARRSARSWR